MPRLRPNGTGLLRGASNTTAFGRLPFPAALVIIAAIGVAAIALGLELGLGEASLLLLVLPVGLAVWYLVEYDRRPVLEAPDDEFDDPVVAADRGEPASRESPTAGPVTQEESVPLRAGGSAPDPPDPESEEFDDPVIEADRVGSTRRPDPPPPAE